MWLTLADVQEAIRSNPENVVVIPTKLQCCECRLVFRTIRKYCPQCHSLNIKPTCKSNIPPS
jgi:predicted Zn-ribbon and HTH transcriptional regulator